MLCLSNLVTSRLRSTTAQHMRGVPHASLQDSPVDGVTMTTSARIIVTCVDNITQIQLTGLRQEASSVL